MSINSATFNLYCFQTNTGADRYNCSGTQDILFKACRIGQASEDPSVCLSRYPQDTNYNEYVACNAGYNEKGNVYTTGI